MATQDVRLDPTLLEPFLRPTSGKAAFWAIVHAAEQYVVATREKAGNGLPILKHCPFRGREACFWRPNRRPLHVKAG